MADLIEEKIEELTDSDKVRAQSINILSMSLMMPHVKDHPNKVPFKGVLCKLDEPSDAAPHGSNGKRIYLSKEVAEKALPSLLGMAVDFTPEFDGHDQTKKIGLITEAYVEGNDLVIQGFFYGADFPEETKRIQSEKDELGFSFEADSYVRDAQNNIFEIRSCVFTGAAVLYKNAAAYTKTSIEAKKITRNKEMSTEKESNELSILKEKISSLENELTTLKANQDKKASLSAANLQHLVQPHADALRAAADGMCAAGVGTHPTGGHAVVLRNMASHMEADAAQGVMPHIYREHDFIRASSDKATNHSSDSSAEFAELKNTLTELKAQNDSLNAKLTDMENKTFLAASAPERKTLPPEVMNLLAKANVKPEEIDTSHLTVKEVDKVLSDAGMTTTQRIAAKWALEASGKL